MAGSRVSINQNRECEKDPERGIDEIERPTADRVRQPPRQRNDEQFDECRERDRIQIWGNHDG
jgi:hypothetical protein